MNLCLAVSSTVARACVPPSGAGGGEFRNKAGAVPAHPAMITENNMDTRQMPLFDISSLDIRVMMAKHMHDIMYGPLAEMFIQTEYYVNQPEETPPKKLFFEAYKGTETKDGTPCVVTMVMPRFALKESIYNTCKIHTEIVARFAFVKKIEKYNGGGAVGAGRRVCFYPGQGVHLSEGEIVFPERQRADAGYLCLCEQQREGGYLRLTATP